MATYAYHQEYEYEPGVVYCYANYNISPDFSYNMGLNDEFTVQAQVRCNRFSIKSVSVKLANGLSGSVVSYETGYTNKSISKSTAGTVTINCRIPTNVYLRNELENWYIVIAMYNATGGENGNWSNREVTDGVSAQSYGIIKNRVAPSANALSFADAHVPISGNQTPLEYFGDYVQSESLPSITATFATDSRDAKLTTSHRLVITDSGDNVVYDVSGTAGALATTKTLQLPAFPNAGTYTAAWTVTDSAGMSGTYTDTFTIAAYTPPSVSVLDLVRFASTPDGDIAADDGENLWLTLEAAVASVNSFNAYTVSLTYSHDGGTETTVAVTSDTDGGAISIAEDDTTPTADTVLYGEVFDALYNYDITLIVSDMLRSVQYTFVVLKAGGYMNVEKYGVAIGRRTHATPVDKRFEVAEDYTSHFGGEVFAEGGIAGVTNYSSGEVSTGGKWIDGSPIYRYIVTGSLSASQYDTTLTAGNIPMQSGEKIGAVVDIRGMIFAASNANFNWIPIPMAYSGDVQFQTTAAVRTSDYAIRLRLGSNSNLNVAKKFYIIVEYTKAATEGGGM